MALEFRKAERKAAKARVALTAPAGGGKSHSALLLASGLTSNGKIAVIDTENGSTNLEVGKPGIPEFDVAVMHAPFTVEKYLMAIKEAEAAGYDVIIIDSLSHSWAGSGGLLDQQGTIADRGGNSFAAWRSITPKANALVDAILQSPAHIIATMRSKADYAMEGGKVTKLGLAPIIREGTDFEFTIVFEIDQSHKASCSKDRTSLFGGKIAKIDRETGSTLKKWLETEGTKEPLSESARNLGSG